MIKAIIKKAAAVCVTSATVLSFAVLPVSAVSYGSNLLTNPGFESGALGDWVKYGGKAASLAVTDTDARTGTYSALISDRATSADGPKQTVNLDANADYLISVWIKPLSTTERTRGKLRFTGDGSLGLSMISCPAGEWTQFTAEINSSSLTGTSNVEVWFQTSDVNAGNAAFYLDDFEIKKILPEQAETDANLLAACDPGFESGTINTALWNKKTVEVTNAKAHTGTYSALSSGRSNNYDGPQVQSVALEASSKYYASAWVYTDASDEQAKIRLQGTGVTNPSLISLTAGEWNHISAVLSTTDAVSAKFYVQTSGTSDIYVDDCAVYKIGTSSVTVTSPLNGSTSAAIDSDLTLTFSDTVLSLDKGNVLINGSAVTGSITKTDDKNFTVDLGTLTNGTEYTVKITNVLDASYNMISDTTVTFTTAAAENPQPEPTPAAAENLIESKDSGFETGNFDSAWTIQGTAEVTNAQAHTGTYSAFSKDRSANSHGPRITVDVEAGQDYYISAWVKPASGVGRGTVRMWKNGGSDIAQPTLVDFAEGVWTHTSAIVNSGTNTSVIIGINTNNTTGGNVNLYIDDFEIIPYTPTRLVSQTPSADSGVSIKETISLTFSNKIEKASKDNFTVTGRTVTGITLSDDKKTVTLTLDKILDAKTEYTVTASGITDMFGVVAETVSFTFTTGESMAVVEAPCFYSGDTPVTTLTVGEITVKAKFRNDGTDICKRPIMMAVMYGADGRMRGIKSTPLTGNLAAGEETGDTPLTLDVTSDVTSVSVYVLSSYDGIRYLISPLRLETAE